MDGRKIRKFERICRELSDLMGEIYEIDKNVFCFVAGEGVTSFNLIDTKGKDDDYWRKNYVECCVSSINVKNTDCGGI